jgi:hypothetical protein
VELTKNEQPEDFLNRFEPHWEEVTSLVKVGAKKLPKMNLKDVEFHELNEKLLVLFNQGILNLFDVTRKIRYEETFDRESVVTGMREFHSNAKDILAEMQWKLDELSETAP